MSANPLVYESNAKKPPHRPWILPLMAAGLSTYPIFVMYPMVISQGPRPMQGESVLIPWPVCVAGQFAIPVLLPYLISLFAVRSTKLRLCFLLFLLLLTLTWYFGFGNGLLSKAWRRGL